LGRGHTHVKLLQYLVERAARGEAPKEFDISVDVFGKTAGSEAHDAQTRVHIFKLRARLDAYYRAAGRADTYRLEIPKGTYHVVAVAQTALGPQSAPSPPERAAAARPSWIGYIAAALLASLLLNAYFWLSTPAPQPDRQILKSAAWAGLGAASRPLLIVVGDHFFFGENGTHLRVRDIAINSVEELRASGALASKPDLVFETLTYLPKSSVFALQTVLPLANAASDNVSLKLVSELRPEDLRDHDVIYIGFVRAMGILREYYFARSNFAADQPLFVSLTNSATGAVYERSGPGPQHNTDYGLVAAFTGPAGNRMLVIAGIGDVGVSAAARALATRSGFEMLAQPLQTLATTPTEVEVLIEAVGHSRTDLGLNVVGAYPFGPHNVAPGDADDVLSSAAR
jgi:hypothetical protein